MLYRDNPGSGNTPPNDWEEAISAMPPPMYASDANAAMNSVNLAGP